MTTATTHSSPTLETGSGGTARTIGLLVAIAGIVMMIAGGVTWATVTSQLAAENITVSEDAANFAGQPVDGPLTAYAEAEIINQHALEATNGQTYAQLDREDPTRQTAMTASFLRASLFTSVLAYGVSAMAMGVGLLMLLIGHALRKLGAARA